MKHLTKQFKSVAALGLIASVAALGAVAGTGGTAQFGSLATQLQGWAQGSLGIVIALAALIVGLSIGVVKQSLMAVVTGIAISIALYYGPTVIVGILSATGAMAPAHLVAFAPIF